MRAALLQHHGLSFLPQLFSSPGEEARARPLSWRQRALLLAVLVPPVLVSLYVSRLLVPGASLHDYLAHGLIEGFCALMSLVVFYVLHQEYLLTGTRRLCWMSYGFLVLGLLDLFHAFAAPESNLFVWYRFNAAFGGALFLALSVHPRFARPAPPPLAPRAWLDAVLLAGGTVTYGLLALQLADRIPGMAHGAHFSLFALLVNTGAALLYAVAGISFVRAYRRSSEPILLLLALAMFLFAESQVLCFFSSLWDLTWWAWHVVRTLIFLAIVFGIAYEFIQDARELQASQATLIESEKLASLGEMAAGIAHEIRNPLGTLTNSLGLLKDGELSRDETRELMEILEKEINRLNHIVSDTLSFAHPHGLRHRPVALAQVLRETLDHTAALYPGVHVDSRFEADLPAVWGDEHQLQRVFWNLLENAVAAMERRGALEVRVARERGEVLVEVQDGGCGIPEELRSQVFKPFFSTKPDGTGLGLPIVQRIVADHGGRIELDSRVAEGTLVRVRLPVSGPDLTVA